MKKMMKLLYTISKLLLITLFISCTNHKEIPFLVTSDFLSNLDSIKKQAPYKITNLVNCDIGYSNLPMKIRNKRNSEKIHQAWDEIVNEYKSECIFYIDTFNTKNRVKRKLAKWIFENNKRFEKQITIDEFKKLLIKEGVKPKDFDIKQKRVAEYDDGYKQLVLELWYKGTVNYITIGENSSINIETFLVSQIPYWETKGYQFSTTKLETIEKFVHKKRN